MITIDDKLKSFSERIIEKVRVESVKKIEENSKRNKDLLESERVKAEKEAEIILENARRSSESQRVMILSKAQLDKEYSILKKKKEIFHSVVEDIKIKAGQYTSDDRYLSFLENSVISCLSSSKSKDIILYFKAFDLEKYNDKIRQIINRSGLGGINARFETADDAILGGCILQSMDGTFRVDSSLKTLIESNMEQIGRMVMKNL